MLQQLITRFNISSFIIGNETETIVNDAWLQELISNIRPQIYVLVQPTHVVDVIKL